MKIGYFLSCEEYGPDSLLQQARLAEEAGFESLWISDHFHPWTEEQGNSPFVWSMIGAISQVTSLPITTAVTCPTIRTHPAVVAQAAATSAVLTKGNFVLGLGSGEALNEHVTGARWPSAPVRLEMLEESIEVMRELWSGSAVEHHGTHYTVEDARLYTLSDTPPPVYVSGFGPRATELAGRVADGFITLEPGLDLIAKFRDAGGAGKPVHAGYKVCWGRDEQTAIDTAHSMWPNEGMPGEIVQTLYSPKQFEQAAALVTKDAIASGMPCGPDLDKHVDAFKPFAEADVDVVHIAQIGAARDATSAEGFFEFYRDQVLPRLRELA
ncbi:F420-dependent oxidoreductase, G6PDH family [Jatrophihabitans endophyticus]|uniref:F420-dependent oxidoreductase, G6PDH family n=1 Tax=Jatrophihabitans endophyticus TaxID=1206085 RepID=A0A1M5Q953_9ACTN|nr:TIGR03557 family F420-dependent LLM class oxidoreductase [Jatrophihabitans endophyticus]SHH10299.1 F420-dependent oxidoreductase, G6PDH family [Jatrophihabitans endophyticus]